MKKKTKPVLVTDKNQLDGGGAGLISVVVRV